MEDTGTDKPEMGIPLATKTGDTIDSEEKNEKEITPESDKENVKNEAIGPEKKKAKIQYRGRRVPSEVVKSLIIDDDLPLTEKEKSTVDEVTSYI